MLLLTRPYHRLSVPNTTLTATLAGLASDEIVSVHLSHAVDGTVLNGVDSHRWQDWSFGLNDPMLMLPTVTAGVTATVTATVPIVSVVTVTPTPVTITVGVTATAQLP